MSLTDGLVSYYKADTSGSFLDAHGSNDGTINGATYTASGKINGAYDFDGVNDYIDIPGFIEGSTQITMAGWVFFNNQTGIQPFSANWATGTNQHMFRCNNGALQFFIQTNTGQYSIVNNNLSTGWYHLGAVYDGSQIRTYVNGVRQTNTAVASGTISTGTSEDRLGRYNNDYLNGAMDEIGFWDIGLTDDDFTKLYNSGNGLSYDNFIPSNSSLFLGGINISKLYLGNTEVPQAYLGSTQVFSSIPPNGLLNGLVSYWKADTSLSFPDSHGSNGGTINGATYTASGKINGCYEFDGINDDISVSNMTITSISLWCSNNDFSSTRNFLISTSSSTTQFFGQFSPSVIYFNFGGGNKTVPNPLTTADNGRFFHFVVTKNGNTVSVYIDNVLAGTFTESNTPVFNLLGGGGPGASYRWDGKMDEICYFNKVLTVSDINNLYNSGSGLSYDNFTT